MTDSTGTVAAIGQTIGDQSMGLTWSGGAHHVVAGDFNGDGRTDLFLQPVIAGGISAVVYADANGQFTGDAPAQSWADGYLGFNWSTDQANVLAGDFNGDHQADLLIQAQPESLGNSNGVPTYNYPPNLNGVVMAQTGATPFTLIGVQSWSRNAFGVDWSPLNYNVVVGDFDGDGRADVLMQPWTANGINYLLFGNAQGAIFSPPNGSLSSSIPTSGDAVQLIVGNFAGGTTSGLLIQTRSATGNNYVASHISQGITGNAVALPILTASSVTDLGASSPSASGASMDGSTVQLAATLTPTSAGRTPGQYSVSPSGAATYDVPIWTPSGARGLEPHLALHYTAGGPDGPIGPGWALPGLSQITRCGKTWASSGGAPAAVTLATSDDICLDGNRLRLVTGTQGVAGSTYQTEIAEFSNVTANGAQGNGPQYFIVKGKDGRTYEYGNTADSRIFGLGATTPYAWALNKISDRQSNNMTFTYSGTAGVPLTPTKIQYTAIPGKSTPAPYEVDFTYVARTGGTTITQYVAGNTVTRSQQLDTIKVLANGIMVRKYALSYTASSTTSRPTLTAFQECGGSSGTDCLRPTTLIYQAGAQGWTTTVTPTGLTGQYGLYHADFNGDGLPDALYARPSGSLMHWYAKLGTATGFGAEIDTLANTNPTSVAPIPIIGRFSGTNKFQFLAPVGTNWSVYTLNAAGTAFSAVTVGVAADVTNFAADYDGDGLPDLLIADPNAQGANLLVRRNITTSGGAVTFSTTTQALYTAPANHYLLLSGTIPVDFNGDGRADVLVATIANTRAGAENWYALLSNGFGVSPTVTPLSVTTGTNRAIGGDFNGDGCSDVFSARTIAISDCHGGFSYIATAAGATGSDVIQFLALDWDGDGQTDVLWQDWTTHFLQLQRSQGNSLAPPVGLGFLGSLITDPGKQFFAADLNSDGQQDLAYLDNSGTYPEGYYAHNGPSTPPDLATSISDGFGINFSPTYVPITKSNYTSKTGAAFPDIDLRAPIYVVDQFSASNGIGGTYTNDFQYTGAQLNLQGREFEGFQKIQQHDSRSGIYQYTYYRQDFPYIGRIDKQEVLESDQATYMARTVNTPAYINLAGTNCSLRCFPYTATSTTYNYELTGSKKGGIAASIANTVTIYTYDTYGSLTDTKATTTDTDSAAPASPFNGQIWITETVNAITNNTPNWCLGRPTRTQTINTVPGQTAQTRTVDHAIDYAACRPTTETVEPTDVKLKVTTTFGYDNACGTTNSVSVVGLDKNGAAMPARVTTSDWGTRCQFPESVKNALNQTSTTTYQYDLGVPLSTQDPNGIPVSWTYDNFGRKLTELRPDSTSTTWSYTDCIAASCWGTTDLRLLTQQQFLDSAGTLVRRVYVFRDGLDRTRFTEGDRALGIWDIEQVIYDSLGRRLRVYVPYSSGAYGNGYHYFTYDVGDRVTQDTLYNASNVLYRTTVLGYSGRTTTVTDPNGKTTTRVSDVAGRIRWLTDSNANGTVAGTTKYTFDPFGNVITIVDANANTSSFVYNIRGFKTSSADADSGAWTYTPDSLNELVSQTDAKSQTTTFGYDPVGRMTSRVEPESTTATSFVFGTSAAAHNIGRLVTVSKPDGYAEGYQYDAVGRAQTVTYTEDGTNYAFDYAYNGQGTLDVLTYPISTSGVRFKVAYVYDAYGYLNQVQNGTGGALFWTLNSANDSNLPTLETLGNGAQVTTGYTPWTNEATSRSVGSGGSTNNLQNLAYQWDLAGNLHQRQDLLQSLTEVFSYDAMNRLMTSTLNATPTLTMAYSASGNITSKSDVGSFDYTTAQGACTYTGLTPQPHAVRNAGGAIYCYDKNGNMTSRQGGALGWTSYNLPSSIVSGSSSTTFNYNADHQRWKQVANYAGTVETTHYIGGLLEVVTSGSGPTEFRHQIPAGSGTAIYVRRSDATISTYYTTSDHLGSSDLVMNGQGTVMTHESFTPFGQRRGSAWTGLPTTADYTDFANTTRRGFAGQDMLDSVSLIHMNGRVYDPKLGRFLSVDPVIQNLARSQTLNSYSYAMNSPLSYVDPSGWVTINVGVDVSASGVSGGNYYATALFVAWDILFPWHPYTQPPPTIVPKSVALLALRTPFLQVSAVDTNRSTMLDVWAQEARGASIFDTYYNPETAVASEVNVPDGTYDFTLAMSRNLALAYDSNTMPQGAQTRGDVPPSTSWNAISAAYSTLVNNSWVQAANTVAGQINTAIAILPLPVGTEMRFLEGVNAARGFGSFSAFKNAMGRAGSGMNWHHIVEQTPGNLARFGPQSIHNTENLVRLDAALHGRISAYYSSIQPFTSGQTVRQWLSTQQLGAQQAFGQQVLRQFGVGP